MKDRNLPVPQWVGCLACLLVFGPWLVGVVTLYLWTVEWACGK